MSISPMISLIVAMNSARVIGYQNRLPWHLPADLKYFRQTTLGKPVIMGRKTYESIGKPLDGRLNIVLSCDPDYVVNGGHVVADLEHALALCAEYPESFIIGGSSIYQLALPQVQRLYITWVEGEYQGDSYFPELSVTQWQEMQRESFSADAHNAHNYCFTIWERKPTNLDSIPPSESCLYS